MPGYLKDGETFESRLDELLAEFRSLPSNGNGSVLRERIAQEVALIGVALQAIPAVTVEYHSAEEPRPDVVTIDDALKAFDLTITDQGPVKPISEERAEFLRRLVGAEPEPPAYSFTPDVIRKIEDSIALQPNADGSTPRLPGEQTPATDAHPEVDFEAEVDLGEEELAALSGAGASTLQAYAAEMAKVGKASDLDDLDPTDDLDDDELADFTPKSGKPAKKPETALSALKSKTTKKETKK